MNAILKVRSIPIVSFKSHWNLFPITHIPKRRHWFRCWLGTEQASINQRFSRKWWHVFFVFIYVIICIHGHIISMKYDLKMTTPPRMGPFQLYTLLNVNKWKNIEQRLTQFLIGKTNIITIERGRHTRPKTPVQEILCKSCGVIEDEAHFMLSCHISQNLRGDLMKSIESIYPEFRNMTENEQIYYIFSNEDQIILTWFGNCLHNSFMLCREPRS